jgi:hypothetical protein
MEATSLSLQSFIFLQISPWILPGLRVPNSLSSHSWLLISEEAQVPKAGRFQDIMTGQIQRGNVILTPEEIIATDIGIS